MTGTEWRRIKSLAGEALAVAAPNRAEFVAGRAGSDDGLRREVLALLEAVETAADLFEAPSFAGTFPLNVLADAVEVPSLAGTRIGAYRILSEIGRGGMGAAYLAARDDQEYEKRVAIKLIKRGMDSDAILRRFRHERQILANLDHPNIVRLLDGGTTADGLPYFVMEFVDGTPVDRYCDELRLPVSRRLTLFLPICAAVQHAHEQRVVHRDLKPNNILVARGGVPKLLDFGIAKVLAGESDGPATEVTMFERALTPLYASPEQTRGEPLTPATDIYSLGVVLYVLLTGRPPYLAEDRSAADLERTVREQAVPPPSTVVDEAAAALRGDTRKRLQRALGGDLGDIVMTALAKDPAHRYASAEMMAEDIRRCLAGEPVSVRRGRVRAQVDRVLQSGLGSRLRPAAVKRAAGAVAAALVIVAGGAFVFDRQEPADVLAAAPRSVVVLPFGNATGEPDFDYLSEGLTEDLISRLSTAVDLKVIARHSAARYAGAVDPQRAREELGVEALVAGEVRHHNGRVEIGVEVIDTRDRSRIWGGRYERPVTDVQGLQRELAGRVARELRVRFTPQGRTRLEQLHTASADAYEMYLKGRHFWNKRTAGALRTSVSYFNRAIEADPSFALAFSGLADSYGLLTEYHTLPATETYGHVRQAVARALELDPDLPEAHTSRGYLREFYEWDWRGAEEAFRTALELNPNYATGHQWYAELLSAMGRHDEALDRIARARQVDPLSLIINAVEAHLLYLAGRYDEAIEKCRSVIELDPNFPEVYEYLKRAYDQKGMYAEAIAARQTRRRLLGRDSADTPSLRAAAAATSPRDYWRHRLQQELLEARQEGLQPYEHAELLAQTGDLDRALDALQRACDEHDFMMINARVSPNLAPLRAHDRYRQLLQRSCRV